MYIRITLTTVGNAHIKIMDIAAHKKLLRKELNSVINSLSHDEVMRQSHILSQKVSVDVNSLRFLSSVLCTMFVLINSQRYDINYVKRTGKYEYFIENLSSPKIYLCGFKTVLCLICISEKRREVPYQEGELGLTLNLYASVHADRKISLSEGS